MTPEQAEKIFGSLSRIEANQNAHKESITRHETALGDLYTKANDQDRFRARVKGGMTALGGLFTMLIALLGLDTMGGPS
jgi:hypothetical protein